MNVPNEILWIGFLLLDLLLVIVVYRFFGKVGLIAYIVLSIITCNLQVMKLVDMFGVTTTLGNILYGSIFFATDLLGEVHGKKMAQKAVWIGFIAVILMTLFMQFALWFSPSEYDEMQPHLVALFGFLPRIVAASLLAYLLSQLHDVWAFHFWREKFQGKHLWLRNNASTLISQLIDSSVFVILAFAPLPVLGVVPGFEDWPVIISVWVTTYVVKLVVAIIDTPFLYWGCSVAKKYKLTDG